MEHDCKNGDSSYYFLDGNDLAVWIKADRICVRGNLSSMDDFPYDWISHFSDCEVVGKEEE